MKFKDLAIGDRFTVNEYGWNTREVYVKRKNESGLDIFHDGANSYNDGYPESLIDIDINYHVNKLGPAIESSLGDSILQFLKENMRLSIDSHRSYSGKGFKIEIKVGDEVVTTDNYILEYSDDD
jgi:hypothetical protein